MLFTVGVATYGSLAFAASDAAPLAAYKSRSVNWTGVLPAVPNAKRGGRVALTLRGTPIGGWHVYGLKQQPNGPIALRVALDPSDLASADGEATASAPIRKFEPAFGVETPYYLTDFAVTVPVRLKPDAPLGRQAVSVSVRFQACANGTCEPPKTIHLAAPVQVVG